MEVVLVDHQEVAFPPYATIERQNDESYDFRSVDVNLFKTHIDKNQAVSKTLEVLHSSNQIGNDADLRNKSVEIVVGMSGNQLSKSSNRKVCKVVLRVQDVAGSGVLRALNNASENRLALTVNLSFDADPAPILINATLTNADLVPADIKKNCSYEQHIDDLEVGGLLFIWEYVRSNITATLTTILLVTDVYLRPLPSIDDKLCINRKLLNEEIACDVNIVLQNGVALKCHKGFLSAHSTVFQTMFQTSMKESHTSTVEIFDMEESSVRAFLAYLYYWEIKEAEKNSLICFELLHAGHKYDIVQLEECMKMILLSKSNEWYDVDVGMRLFLFARNLEKANELKMKAIQVLKSKVDQLKQSDCYQELFKKDLNAAMELCECAFSA